MNGIHGLHNVASMPQTRGKSSTVRQEEGHSDALLDTVSLSSQALHQTAEGLVEADHHGLHKQLALMATRAGVKPGLGAAGATKVSAGAGQNTALGQTLGKAVGPVTAGLGFYEAGKVAQEMQHEGISPKLGAEFASHSLHGVSGTCQSFASFSSGAAAASKLGGVAGGGAYVCQGFADRMSQDPYTQNVGRAEALAGGCMVAGAATLDPPLLIGGAVLGVGAQVAKLDAVRHFVTGTH